MDSKVKKFFVKNYKYFLAGLIIGGVAIVLGLMGNPKNMAFCIACFLRDIAGSLGLHNNAAVQYARPEIIGIVLGAFTLSMIRKEFKVTGGSAPLTRFLLGMLVMIGALVFLGCPLRMVLRIAGGDLNAVIGLLGFAAGISVGVIFLNKGFSLNRTHELPKLEGYLAPASSGVLLFLILIALIVPSTAILLASTSGPGSMYAPIWATLIGGLIVGGIGQVARVCFISGIRDSILFRQFNMLYTFGMILITVLIGNLISGNFNLGFTNQPIAHQDHIWNFLGLFLVGLGSVFLGGCPFRQLVLAGSGNSDSAITVLGLIAGAAISHNFKLAASTSGVGDNGKIAVVVGIIIALVIGILNIRRFKKTQKNSVSVENTTANK